MIPNDSRMLALKIEKYSDIKRYKDVQAYIDARRLIIELQDYLISENPTSISQLPDKYNPITNIKV